MNPITLTSENSDLKVYVCGRCRYTCSSLEHAERCCKCSFCGEPTEAKGRVYHHECWRKDHDERWAQRLADAEEVPYEGGFVYTEAGGGQDGFHSDMDSLLDYLADEAEVDRPEFVFACKSHHKAMGIGDILEQLCCDGYEDMEDYLTVPESLGKAVEEFNEKNRTALTVWDYDLKRKHRVPLEELEH